MPHAPRALRRAPFDREIVRLALPALGALAADPLVSLVDTAYVGRLGTEALASLAVAAAVFGVAFSVFNFLQYGTTPLLRGNWGRTIPRVRDASPEQRSSRQPCWASRHSQS